MIFSLCSALACFAQGNGMAGISEATNMVTSYFRPAHETDLRRRGNPRTGRRRARLLEILVG